MRCRIATPVRTYYFTQCNNENIGIDKKIKTCKI